MGQKGNLITLRNFFINFNLQNQNSKAFLLSLFFIFTLNKLASKKKILISNFLVNTVGGKLFLNLTLFYNTAKLLLYKKKIKFLKQNNINFFSKKNLHLNFINNLFKRFKLLKINLFIFNIKILNLDLKKDKKVLLFFFLKCKSFIHILFKRRYSLFFDFIKQVVLLLKNLISINAFIKIVSFLFRFLHKNLHSRFLFFWDLISSLIINNSYIKKKLNSNIKGLKLLLKGRIKGKMRASSHFIQKGSIPTQTIKKKVEFINCQSRTVYGVYGLTLWIYRG